MLNIEIENAETSTIKPVNCSEFNIIFTYPSLAKDRQYTIFNKNGTDVGVLKRSNRWPGFTYIKKIKVDC